MPTAIARIERAAATPVAAHSSAAFRILFGLLGVFGVVRFVAKGWVETLYLNPEHHLTYEHFGWVHPWPPPWMYAHVAMVGLASLALAVGFHSRVAAAAYFVAFGYLELIDGALYLNHYWWVTLGAGWLVVLPVHDTWAVSSRTPRGTVPAIVVWILRAQLAVVYVFAGLAKLNSDWLVEGNPLAIWLGHAELGLLASWSGALFDCTIVAWLLWPKTRTFAYLAVIVFHTVTGALFQIGLFPMVMIAGTLVFFDPDWPLRLVGQRADTASPPVNTSSRSSRLPRLGIISLLVVALLQVAVPLRHFANPGNVRWTEEGYYLSWRVMLTEKSGTLRFDVTNPETGEVWRIRPESVLEDWQVRQAAIRSDLLLATAHIVAADFADRGFPNVEVRAESFVSFNGRPRQRYADPSVDLAALPRGAAAHTWLLPLEDPYYD